MPTTETNTPTTSTSSSDKNTAPTTDYYAAHLLINELSLRDLARWHRHDLNSLAMDLEVTPRLLRLYLTARPLTIEDTGAKG